MNRVTGVCLLAGDVIVVVLILCTVCWLQPILTFLIDIRTLGIL